jgi:hypothetical protein
VNYKYENFDSGVDFDFIILEKKREEILLSWDNWFEGELQCSEHSMNLIENLVNEQFVKGKPKNLKPEIIRLYRPRS